MKDKVLILGVSSWIGFLLSSALLAKKISVSGTIFTSDFSFQKDVDITRVSTSDIAGHTDLIQRFNPTVIVNFLRGEDTFGYQLHKHIIALSSYKEIHYIYASSILALDGYKNTALTETLEPFSVSEYGRFKGKCEMLLHESEISFCILRFSSVQGWVPHKRTRNQLFLTKLNQGKEIIVDTGVIQNRAPASLLVDLIVDLLVEKTKGVIHFGSEDFSEEVDFLRQQALTFGYKKELIVEGGIRNINLVAKPDRIYSLYGKKYRIKERQTLQALLQIDGLKKYLSL